MNAHGGRFRHGTWESPSHSLEGAGRYYAVATNWVVLDHAVPDGTLIGPEGQNSVITGYAGAEATVPLVLEPMAAGFGLWSGAIATVAQAVAMFNVNEECFKKQPTSLRRDHVCLLKRPSCSGGMRPDARKCACWPRLVPYAGANCKHSTCLEAII